MEKQYKRKYWVDTGYQLGQAAAVVFAHLAVVVLMGALLSWFYLIVWDGSVIINHNRQVPLYLMGMLVGVTLVSIFASLKRSRSVAGMAGKIHTVLDDAAKGRFPDGKLAFRQSDYFKPLADPLNRCLEQLQNQGDLDRALDRVSLVIDEMPSGTPEMDRVRASLVQALSDVRPCRSRKTGTG